MVGHIIVPGSFRSLYKYKGRSVAVLVTELDHGSSFGLWFTLEFWFLTVYSQVSNKHKVMVEYKCVRSFQAIIT